MVEEIHFFFTFFWIYGNDFLLLLAHLNSVSMHCLYVLYTSVLSHFSFHHHIFCCCCCFHQHHRTSNQPIGFLHFGLFHTYTQLTLSAIFCYLFWLLSFYLRLSLSSSLPLQHAHGTKQLSAHILYYERRKLSTHRTKRRFECRMCERRIPKNLGQIHNIRVCIERKKKVTRKNQRHDQQINNICKSNWNHMSLFMVRWQKCHRIDFDVRNFFGVSRCTISDFVLTGWPKWEW